MTFTSPGKKSLQRKQESNPGSVALEVDVLTTRLTRRQTCWRHMLQPERRVQMQLLLLLLLLLLMMMMCIIEPLTMLSHWLTKQ